MNVKVTLLHKNATPEMKLMAARVIDGSLIHATTSGGRRQDAISIYNRMMGIKATTHDYETVETSEPPYEPPPPPVSEAGLYEQRQQAKQLGGVAKVLAEAVTVGVTNALAAKGLADVKGVVASAAATTVRQKPVPEPSSAPASVEPASVAATGTMRQRPRL